MAKARETLVQTLTKYYSLQPSQRPGLCWLFDRMQSEQRKLGMTVRDAASIGVSMIWTFVPRIF
jgi:hypothetical protein